MLKNLQSDTEYSVTVVPVYHEMEGLPQTENGKTSEWDAWTLVYYENAAA